MCAGPAVATHPQVVFTPHLYPPSITMATFLGTTLWEQCRASFGYLQTEGEGHSWLGLLGGWVVLLLGCSQKAFSSLDCHAHIRHTGLAALLLNTAVTACLWDQRIRMVVYSSMHEV